MAANTLEKKNKQKTHARLVATFVPTASADSLAVASAIPGISGHMKEALIVGYVAENEFLSVGGARVDEGPDAHSTMCAHQALSVCLLHCLLCTLLLTQPLFWQCDGSKEMQH
ncbi:unnamed protein product [Sphagnum troendelagicum]|uniref:Uncharacterized protein n=1 Tax=Sphagnum troendelagicum TaxID=128251 RepID=A0ABP0TGM8_9BRYO